MINIPQKVSDRFSKHVKKYSKILESARKKDINESDTVKIVSDFLTDVCGYDRYDEITGEYEIKGNLCDLAIKINDNVHFLIEVKSIGTSLRESHLNQALFYSQRMGIDWAILTNGVEWLVYKIKFGKPITHQLLFRLDLIESSLKEKSFKEQLFLISKEAIKKSAIESYHKEKSIVNKFMIAEILQKDNVLRLIRKELKLISKDVIADDLKILEILQNGVIKRELLDSDEIKSAKRAVKSASRKAANKGK